MKMPFITAFHQLPVWSPPRHPITYLLQNLNCNLPWNVFKRQIQPEPGPTY